ncbi:MAG: hypothetical protein ACR2JM_03320, partial [Mycobacterium sp.]
MPAPADTVSAPAISVIDDGTGVTDSASARPGRRSAGPRSGAGTTRLPSRGGGTSSAAQPSAEAALINALFTPGGMQDLVQKTVTSFFGDLVSNAMGAVSQIPAAGIAGVPQSVEAAVAAAPVMTAAASTDALSATEDAAAALTGDGTGAPAAAPLVWAAVAASRREDLAGATPELPVAATTTTAAPASTSAAPAAAIAPAAVTVPKNFTFGPSQGFVGTTVAITSGDLLQDIK